MSIPRGYTKKDLESIYHHFNQDGNKAVTEVLDAVNTTETMEFGDVYKYYSFQSSGTLAGTVEFSINGETFYQPLAFTPGTPVSYVGTHQVCVVRITRTGGTGKLHMAGGYG